MASQRVKGFGVLVFAVLQFSTRTQLTTDDDGRTATTTNQRARLAEDLNLLFDRMVEVPRIRYGSGQTLDTLINEEAYLLAKSLRNEKQKWIPRIASLTY